MAAAIEQLPPLKSAPKATYALARNLTKLKPLRDDVFSTRDRIFEEKFDLKPGQKFNDKYPVPFDPNAPPEIQQRIANDHLKAHASYGEADAAFQEVLKIEVAFEPHQFDIDDLNLAENSIGVAHLEMLLPLVKEHPGKNGAV